MPVPYLVETRRVGNLYLYFPEELVRNFSISLIKNGEVVVKKEIQGNVQRLCRVDFEKTLCDSVNVEFLATHGAKEIRIFEIRIK